MRERPSLKTCSSQLERQEGVEKSRAVQQLAKMSKDSGTAAELLKEFER